jgi:hypothetical protein
MFSTKIKSKMFYVYDLIRCDVCGKHYETDFRTTHLMLIYDRSRKQDSKKNNDDMLRKIIIGMLINSYW